MKINTELFFNNNLNKNILASLRINIVAAIIILQGILPVNRWGIKNIFSTNQRVVGAKEYQYLNEQTTV